MNSAAVWKRCDPGPRTAPCAPPAPRSPAGSGSTEDSSGTRASLTRCISSASPTPSVPNSRRLANSSQRMTPTAYKSLRASTGCPSTCSGLMYASVPRSAPASPAHHPLHLGHAEVGELHVPRHAQQDVGGVDVAVDDVGAVLPHLRPVQVVQRLEHAPGDVAAGIRGHRRAHLHEQPLHEAQGAPTHQLLHHQVVQPRLVEPVGADDVRVAQAHGELRLVHEGLHVVGVRAERGVQPLEHHLIRLTRRALRGGTGAGLVHLGHAAYGKATYNFVPTEFQRVRHACTAYRA